MLDAETIKLIGSGVVVFFMILGAAVYPLKKNGLITFGKPKERRNCAKVCTEHSGLVEAIDNSTKVQSETNDKLDLVISNVDRILGAMGVLPK
jgi:hypothetical protein